MKVFYLLLLFSLSVVAQQPGSLDISFNSNDYGFGKDIMDARAMAIQNDGKIVVAMPYQSRPDLKGVALTRINNDGSIDNSFIKGRVNTNRRIYKIIILSEGKILIAGNFNEYNGVVVNYLARLNSDGSLDTSFNVGIGTDKPITELAVQNDGKIVLGGSFRTINNIFVGGIARLNSDGSLDTTFDSGVGTNGYVSKLAVQADGNILVSGDYDLFNNEEANGLVRLNKDGTLDNNFDAGTGPDNAINAMVVQDDGKIVIGGQFKRYNGILASRLARLNSDGSIDTSFNTGTGIYGTLFSIKIQSDGKILISGTFPGYNETTVNRIARLHTNGSLDTSFNTGTGADDGKSGPYIGTMVIQSDGKIVISGDFENFNGIYINGLARLGSDGSLDMSFNEGTGANHNVYTSAKQSDGKILIGGSFNRYNGKLVNNIARLNTEDGSLDTSFDAELVVSYVSVVEILKVQGDGKIIVGSGVLNRSTGTSNHNRIVNRVRRLNSDGSIDTSFTDGIIDEDDGSVYGIEIQQDGKILLYGDFINYNGTGRSKIVRLNSDGSIDTGFTEATLLSDSKVWSVVVQNDNKIIIGGDFGRYNGYLFDNFVRLNMDGNVDFTFASGGKGFNDVVKGVFLQNDGKILVYGWFNEYNGTDVSSMVRMQPDGILDDTFSIVGVGDIRAVAFQGDGKILLGGDINQVDNQDMNDVVRINSDGSVDDSFSTGISKDDHFLYRDYVHTLTIQDDGKIIIGGTFHEFHEEGRNRIARLLASEELSIDKVVKGGEVLVYPNPAKEVVNINLEKSIQLKNINIYNIQKQFLFSTKEKSIDVSRLTSGFYFIEVETNQGKSTKKIIIE
ncbi:T9SS type A sorting domain-containing protein [Hyunsoonleella sp. SJ7]|uniref:T9SS type A sorting domain-containing protein n=1 Tax=Hyunsoonleella aquatilis TaxID=2762758 RepID=A0A923HKD3_9FLAO|nr:T9SS type A sorting domain-containing protein [Hyunsoonleella aquatilis]MBC3759917.1 T9SS type A sorting domain-containing protein [Hyunsoonleella aquatilis]